MTDSMNISSNSNTDVCTTRPLSQAQVAQYHEEGFVIIRGFFDLEEIKPLRQALKEENPILQEAKTDFAAHSNGYSTHFIYWMELSNSLLGTLPRLARVVDTVELLLGGKECYHWHSKIAERKPHSPGILEWHQDYGVWYYDTCLFPDFVTAVTALEKNFRGNGCVEIIKKSHLINRIDQVVLGDCLLADPVRVEKILEKLDVFYAEMEPGDTLFIHANTIHRVPANKSDHTRPNLVTHYNAASNEPVDLKDQEYRRYKPIQKLPDSWILDGKYNSVFNPHDFLKTRDFLKPVKAFKS